MFSSLLAGAGISASFSAAALLQHLLPGARIGEFPVAGMLGLLSGWLFAVPVTRRLARRLNPERLGRVLLAATISGLVWATPAALFAPALGWMVGAVRILIVAALLSASALIWGGYLDCDAWSE